MNLKKEKERDFLLAYESELKALGDDAPFVPRDEVILRTLHSGRGGFYISFEEAARLAKRANPSQMWLTHYSPSLVKPEDYMDGVRKIFPEAYPGKDGKSVELAFAED